MNLNLIFHYDCDGALYTIEPPTTTDINQIVIYCKDLIKKIYYQFEIPLDIIIDDMTTLQELDVCRYDDGNKKIYWEILSSLISIDEAIRNTISDAE